MDAAPPLIPELEDIIQRGTREKRGHALRQIAMLFLKGADRYSDAQVDLFGGVFGLLIKQIETKTRAELAGRLAPVRNAPAKVIRTLANDDHIAVAGPVLQQAPQLAEADLIDLARTKSQAHLQAISARPVLGEAVTDVLVQRGDREVLRGVAANHGARISRLGFVKLVKRAEVDGVLAEKVGLRPDIPAPAFRDLLVQATAIVRERLSAAATTEVKAEIRRVLTKVSKDVGAEVGPRDYSPAQRLVLQLVRTGRLDETALTVFCADGKYEETVVGLAALAKVPVEVAARLMRAERPDALLILGKACALNWVTVKGIIGLRADGKTMSTQMLSAACADYERLSAATALRVIRFWRARRHA